MGPEWIFLNTVATAVVIYLTAKAYLIANRRGRIIINQSAQIRLYCDIHVRMLRDYTELINIENFDSALAQALLDLPETDYFKVVDLLDSIGSNFEKLCKSQPLIYKVEPTGGKEV